MAWKKPGGNGDGPDGGRNLAAARALAASATRPGSCSTGRGKSEAFHRAAEEYWKRLIEVNLFGTMICTRQALGGMIARRYGRIINIASVPECPGFPN